MTNRVRFFDPGKGYKKLKLEMDSEINRVLSAGDLILRNDVEDFESNIAEYVGTKYALGLNSCTDALYLALRALKIGPGDEVLVPSRTFVASAQVIVLAGATPVYYDIDGILNFSEKTKAIIPVHIEGAFDQHFEDICLMAKNKGWYIIEDAAQALGATQNGKRAGSIGIAGCFSFYPAKILGAYGDAGALVTDNEAIYNYVKGCRNHFKETASDWGINSRLDNLQAAILNVKFKYFNEALARREEVAKRYEEALKALPIILPLHTPGRVWQDYIIRTDERDALYAYLSLQGIETMKNNYPFPVPKLPGAQKYEDETLRLPCNELLEDDEIEYVIKNVIEFYSK